MTIYAVFLWLEKGARKTTNKTIIPNLERKIILKLNPVEKLFELFLLT